MNQNPTIRIRMLGSFTLQQDGMPEPQPVSLTGRSGRLWTLAAYLILRRDHGVPAQELIELLWPNGDNSNPASTLQNNASRVRSALAAMGFTDAKSLIRFEDGCYTWAPDRETLLDADEFEALALRAIDENDPAKALETARQALDLYEGNFLAEASTELWCANLTTYYRSLFMRVSRKAAYELMKEQRFPEAITLCSRVVQLDPMAEEFSILLMRSFTANMQPQQALEHFQLVREHYQREFGIEPSSDLETEKRAAMQELYGSKLDESLLQSFLEQDRREKTAFYCDNGTFREIMKLQLRALRRSETPAQLLMLVLEGLETQPDKNAVYMQQMKLTLLSTLRAGDPFTQIGASQFWILLPGASSDTQKTITGRIQSNFYRRYPHSRAVFRFKMVDLHQLLNQKEPSGFDPLR